MPDSTKWLPPPPLRPLPAVVRFGEESTFHGIGYVLRSSFPWARRVFWAVMFCTSLGFFFYFTVSTVRHYRDYPAATNVFIDTRENVLVPALAFCPGTAYKGIFPTTSEWKAMTDKHYLLFYALRYSQTVVDFISADKVGLKREIYDFLQALPEDVPANMTSEVLNKLGLASKYKVWVNPFTENLRRIPSDLQVDLASELPALLLKYGVTNEHLDVCYVNAGPGHHRCEGTGRQVLTMEGTCLVLDQLPRNDTRFLVRESITDEFQIRLYTSRNTNFGLYRIMVYNHREVPNLHYDSLYFTTYSKSVYLKLNKVTESVVLGKPYDPESCGDRVRSECIQECLVERLNCSLFYLPTRLRPGAQQKPMCPLNAQFEAPSKEISHCKSTCPRPCREITYFITTQYVDNWPTGGVTLKISFAFEYVKLTEKALYEVEALMGELGGTLGLFLGASVLTIYHLLEFILLRVVKPG